VNAGNADSGLEVWCGFEKRRVKVLVETSVATDVEAEKERIS